MPFTIDVDSHVYEPPEIWNRYVAADDRALARSGFYHELDDEGNRLTIVNGAPGKELNRSRLVRQAIWKPGMTEPMMTRAATARAETAAKAAASSTAGTAERAPAAHPGAEVMVARSGSRAPYR